MSIRQVRRKQSSIILQHPSTSLHLVQISKFIQDYQHARMLYNINLNAAIAQNVLVQLQQSQQEFNLSLDVPYIQSQHFQSNNTFTQQQPTQHSSIENFTDEEQNSVEVRPKHRKITMLQEDHQEFKEEDFKFVSRQDKSHQNDQSQFRFCSTKYSSEFQKQLNNKNEDTELYRLQETAYFSQTPHQNNNFRVIYEKMNESSKENRPLKGNQKQQALTNEGWSKKAMFLNKIQKQKSRKEIAQQINRQRHHLQRFLK